MVFGSPRSSRNFACLALGFFFAFEFSLFDQVGARHYTWVYPRWNDQIQYLTESYLGYEYARAHGFLAGLWSTLVNPAAQGTLHDFWALLLFKVVGPSRSAALSLNILFLIVWQAGLFVAARRAFQSYSLAWLAIGLTLCLRSPWTDGPGSAWDFRLDWMAACVMGTTSVAALFAMPFRSTPRSLIFGLAVAWLLLTRFLSGTYLLVIYIALFATVFRGEKRGRRTINLLLSGVVATALAGPIFWLNRDLVYTYYLIGHYFGPESALRAPHMGVLDSAHWLLRCLANDHLGSVYLWAVGLVVGCLWFGVLILPKLKRARPPAADLVSPAPTSEIDPLKTWWLIGTLFLLAPLLVLTLHIQKSPVVADIFLGGTVILCVAVFVSLLQRIEQSSWFFRRGFVTQATSIVILTIGVVHFFNAVATNPHTPEFAASARTVNRLADLIYERSRLAGLASPRVGVDRVTDCFDGQVLRVICYERKKTWVPFIMTLPTGIAEDQEVTLRERLSQSDFMFLTQEAPPGRWPYDFQMERMRPELTRWCDENLKQTERFESFGLHMALYQRKQIP